MSYEVAGKVVLITGAASGIGRALAAELRTRGARLALLDLEEPEGADLALAGDVRDREAMAEAVDRVVAELGQLDVVVANAGVAPDVATVRTMDPDDYDRVIAVNQTGVFNTVHPAVESVIESRGHIVVVSSVASFVPGLGAAPYNVSKAAVEQLGRALRLELAPYGASAGVAYFGFVQTPMVRKHVDEDPVAREGLKQLPFPLRRRISPETAAKVIADGIARRAPRTIAPAAWRPYSMLRGLVNVFADRRIARDRRVHEIVRDVEATRRRTRVPTGE